MIVRFDTAWTNVRSIARELSDKNHDVVALRDLLGRTSIVVAGKIPVAEVDHFSDRIRAAAGAFVAPMPLRPTEDLFDSAAVTDSPDLFVERERTEHHGRLAILERAVVGADWTRSPAIPPSTNRVTLYGVKGGVGRSTAAFMLGRHLANLGMCVLVVDLDLESPGISALLQSTEGLPDHGIVDYLVEDAVGNTEGLDLVQKSLLRSVTLNGELWLAPAAGRPREDYDYVAKLNRIYTDLPPSETRQSYTFADRIEAAVSACERQVSDRSRPPDVVLLDSRAGIHDVAAVALTRLGGLNLLFGADSPQTWRGYSELFKQWQHLTTRRQLTQRLRMVSSMTISDSSDSYLANFRDHAQSCFAETLYEDADAQDLDAFNFAVEDSDAPHSPLVILFNRDLVGLDATQKPGWHGEPLIQAAFADFLQSATALIRGEIS